MLRDMIKDNHIRSINDDEVKFFTNHFRSILVNHLSNNESSFLLFKLKIILCTISHFGEIEPLMSCTRGEDKPNSIRIIVTGETFNSGIHLDITDVCDKNKLMEELVEFSKGKFKEYYS
jgi:hypothetical protein